MQKPLSLLLAIILSLNLLKFFLYFKSNQFIPINWNNYILHSDHFEHDYRLTKGYFDFFQIQSPWDGQWYLFLGQRGYPEKPHDVSINGWTNPTRFTYAFFPLYPILLKINYLTIGNIYQSAFILTNIILIITILSLFYTLNKIFNQQTAFWTTLLLFTSPFAIFLNSYYPEGLFLLLLSWFSNFLIKRKWLLTSLFMGLLIVTKPNGLFLYPVFIYFLIKSIRNKNSVIKIFPYILISIIPFCGLLLFNSIYTSDPLFFFKAQRHWYQSNGFLDSLLLNIQRIKNYYYLPLHDFQYSKIDILSLIYGLILIITGRKYIKRELLLISICLFIFPLVLKNTQSFSRYQIVSFPLFIALSEQISNKFMKFLILTLFIITYLVTSQLFINWYWIG
jgi:Gpi18-like mannosyltransferase